MASPAHDVPARRAARAAAVLVAASVVAVGLVAIVHDRAEPLIEASRRAQRLAQLTAVLGNVAYDNDPLTDTLRVRDPDLLGTDEPLAVHRVRLGDRTLAALLNVVAPDGYSGAIHLLVAISAEGRVLGVRVLEHRETPGLGDLIDTRRSDWIHGFAGRSLGDPPAAGWRVRKDGGEFDQFTGATVTPRAVVRAVRSSLEYFEQHRAELLDEPPAP